jgi:hypothetical protein
MQAERSELKGKESPARRWTKRVLNFMRSTAWVAWVALVGLVVSMVVARLRAAPSLQEQLEAIGKDAVANSMYPVIQRPVDLRGGQSRSYLIVLRDAGLAETNVLDRDNLSDRVRIYEAVDERLRLRFDFSPSGFLGDNPYVFRLDSISDLNADGWPEIIGSFSPYGMGPFFPHPVVIGWDPSGSYRIAPLLTDRPGLARIKRRGIYGQGVYESYLRPDRLHSGKESFLAYGAEDYVLVRRAGQTPILVAGYIAKAEAHADLPLVEVLGWVVDLSWPTTTAFQCIGGPQSERIFFRPRPGPVLLSHEILRTWRDRRGESLLGCFSI